MAQAQTFRFGKAFVLLGDSTDVVTANYVAPCGFEELTMTINIESNSVNIPDCDDPDLAAWLATDIISKQMTIGGNGVLDMVAMQTWKAWWFDDLPGPEVPVRWFRNLTGAQGGGYFQALGTLTAYEETGQRGNRWRNSMTIALNGKPTFTAAA